MKDISGAQLAVLLLMHKQNYSLVCNEGADYKCWLEDEKGNKIPYVINRNTGNSLHAGGWVDVDLTRDGGSYKFYHKLTKKTLNRLDFWNCFPAYKRELDSLLQAAYRKIHKRESVKNG